MGVVKKIKESLLKRSRYNEERFYKEVFERFSVDGKPVNVGAFVRIAARRNSRNTALIGREKTITYKELYVRALEIAQKLADDGVKRRDRVLLYCENSIEFYIFYYAI